MAKLECNLRGSFSGWLAKIESGILNGSMSASLEESADTRMGDVLCSLRVFERYSMIGSNRLSLTVQLFGRDDAIHLTAVSSGGSSAMFFKINTFGEEAFLDRLRELIQ